MGRMGGGWNNLSEGNQLGHNGGPCHYTPQSIHQLRGILRVPGLLIQYPLVSEFYWTPGLGPHDVRQPLGRDKVKE